MRTQDPSESRPSAQAVTTMSRTPGSRRVLYVEQNRDGTVGGSYRSLLFLVQGLDRQAYTSVVAFYREHELLDDFRLAGCRTLLLWHPHSIDLCTPLRRIGTAGRLAALPVRLLQKLMNFCWVSVSLFVRNLMLLWRERIDLLHLNNGVGVGLEFLLAAKLLGLKCVVHQRGIHRVPSWCSWLARRADHVICVSEAARQNLIDHGLALEQCTTIHNGIDFDALFRQIRRDPTAVREALGLTPQTAVVGLAGMIRPWKGQFVLVKAIDRLTRAHPTMKVIIMGGVSDQDPRDAAYLDEIRAFIRERGLDNSIIILGHQPNALEFLQIFDIMVHAAIDPEPFSRVVIEGMALGRAIVASSTGGTPEAIQDGVSGFLVPPDDPDSLADRIDLLLRRPDLREAFGGAARETVVRKFLIQHHVARTQAIYDSLIGASPRSASATIAPNSL